MKKFTAIAAIVLIVVAMTCCFAACNDSIEGTYYFEQMTYSAAGVTVDIKAGEKFMGVMVLEKETFVLTLEKDGTAKMSSALMGVGTEQKGTWESKGGKYVCTMDGEEQEFTVKDGKLTIEAKMEGLENAKLVMKKG